MHVCVCIHILNPYTYFYAYIHMCTCKYRYDHAISDERCSLHTGFVCSFSRVFLCWLWFSQWKQLQHPRPSACATLQDGCSPGSLLWHHLLPHPCCWDRLSLTCMQFLRCVFKQKTEITDFLWSMPLRKWASSSQTTKELCVSSRASPTRHGERARKRRSLGRFYNRHW